MKVSTLIKYEASTLVKHDEISGLIKLDAFYAITVDALSMIYHDASSMNKDVRFLAVFKPNNSENSFQPHQKTSVNPEAFALV